MISFIRKNKNPFLKAFLVVLISTSGAHADAISAKTPHPKIGFAPYAIQSPNFNCDAFIESLSTMKDFSISWLWWTFGKETSCLEKIWKDKRLKAVELHLMNEVCVRKNNCGKYEVLYGLSIKEISKLAEEENAQFMKRILDYSKNAAIYIKKKQTKRPDVKCFISPGLESNTSPAGIKKIISHLRPLFPQCKFVFNPLKGNKDTAGADFIEGHHPFSNLPSPCIFNNDGDSISFAGLPSSFKPNFHSSKISEINKRFQNCEHVFFWTHEYNCIIPEKFLDPRQRPCDQYKSFLPLGKNLGKLQNSGYE